EHGLADARRPRDQLYPRRLPFKPTRDRSRLTRPRNERPVPPRNRLHRVLHNSDRSDESTYFLPIDNSDPSATLNSPTGSASRPPAPRKATHVLDGTPHSTARSTCRSR